MADDALESVLRLVADGRLTAEEARPILDALAVDADDLDVLRALERGDIDLDEARRRLAELDGSVASDDGRLREVLY